ncbi:MAG TPA: hypothetical protein PLX53_02315, partial [Tenuifilaceae bacterium]|nr:hypothetical protein [Tenuifilaceae bacterium]
MEKNIGSRGGVITVNEASEHSVCSSKGCTKLKVHDWMADLPMPLQQSDIIEVQFKNTRKGFYRNANQLVLRQGD